MTIEEIILPDGTPAKRLTSTFDGEAKVSIITPMLKVRFLPNVDHEGGDHETWSRWDEDRQRVVPHGLGASIERGEDAGKPQYWWNADVGMWCGRLNAVDHKSILETYVKDARRNLANESLHPILQWVTAAEVFLRETTSDFFVDDERLRAKEISAHLRKYNDQQWQAQMASSVRRQKEELAEAMNGKFIEKPRAVEIMNQAEFKMEKRLDPWSGTVIPNSGGKKRGISYFHDLMINYEGKWRRICRVDLANQCPTGSYNIDGSNHPKDWWIGSVLYGVVVTDEEWYVVDATTDG